MKKPAYTLRPYSPPLQRTFALDAGGLVCASGDNPDSENIKKDDDDDGVEEGEVDTRRFFWY